MEARPALEQAPPAAASVARTVPVSDSNERSAQGHRSLAVEIFLVSLAVVLLEINYTRIFSFKLYYYFTYFIIGIALLGLGSGAVLVALSRRLRAAPPREVLATACTVGSASVVTGFWIIAVTRIDLQPVALPLETVLGIALFAWVLSWADSMRPIWPVPPWAAWLPSRS
jgi:hypothetical protein